MLTDPRVHVRTDLRHLDLQALMAQPPTALIGVSDDAAKVLSEIQVFTIFDLALSRIFLTAVELADTATADSHPFRRVGRVAADRVSGKGDQADIASWLRMPIEALDGIGQSLGPRLRNTLAVRTIGDMAAWPPFLAARTLLEHAMHGQQGAMSDPEMPTDLVPKNGEYPTEKVYYTRLFLRNLEGRAPKADIATGKPIDLGLGINSPVQGIGYGAIVTYEQAWYGKGVALGNLLHSIALAPGEATYVAIIDWTRTVSASTSEAVDQVESLSASTSQNRALSEVTEGVATEVQTGFSRTKSSSKTTSAGLTTGGAMSYSGGQWSAGGGHGLALGQSRTEGSSSTVTFTSGRRDTFASFAQNVAESTQQHSSSARSRRASIVTEVRESTSERLQTRVVANYNHMHALSVCYYEIVQLYRAVLRPTQWDKVLFVPIAPLDFTSDAVIDRFRKILARVALDEVVFSVLTAGSPQVTLANSTPGVRYWRVNQAGPTTAKKAQKTASPGLVDDNDLLDASNKEVVAGAVATGSSAGFKLPIVSIAGPIRVSHAARFTKLQATAEETELSVMVTKAGSKYPTGGFDGDMPVVEVDHLGVFVPKGLVASEIKFEMEITDGSNKTSYRLALPVPVVPADRPFTSAEALYVLADDLSPSGLARAKAHLHSEAAWYTARIWERLDQATLAALLAGYQFDGKPLLNVIDPLVLGVTGTHAAFRMLLDGAERQAFDRQMLEEWGLEDGTRDDLIPLPTGGVFAEAVLGRFNSAEKLDLTRFWKWQDSPPVFSPPSIAALQAGQNTPTAAPVPGSLDAPVVNLIQQSPMPNPTGIGGVLGLLSTPNIFRDMSYAAQNVDAMKAAMTGSVAAHEAVLKTAQEAFATGAALTMSASEKGATLNAAKGGVPGADRYLPSASVGAQPTDASIATEKKLDTIDKTKEAGRITSPQANELSRDALQTYVTDGKSTSPVDPGVKSGSSTPNTAPPPVGAGNASSVHSIVIMQVDSVDISDGNSPDANLTQLLNTLLNVIAGDIHDWWAPEWLEALRTSVTLDVRGTLNLMSNNGALIDQRSFQILSNDAIALVKSATYPRSFNKFVPQMLQLLQPVTSLKL